MMKAVADNLKIRRCRLRRRGDVIISWDYQEPPKAFSWCLTWTRQYLEGQPDGSGPVLKLDDVTVRLGARERRYRIRRSEIPVGRVVKAQLRAVGPADRPSNPAVVTTTKDFLGGSHE